ncbi:MAG TPA: copper chaperone PCu(A)C [Turneriella sp.]|nr:copper chaperone PCu(A)C [Turneriella sp.]
MTVRRTLHQVRSWSAATRISATFVAMLFAACNQVQHRENGLVFGDWYIVKPVVDNGMTTAYGTITNSAAEATTLEAVALDCAEKVELHETIESAGRVSMVGLGRVTLPAGLTLAFQPGKKHLMISGLRQIADGKCRATFTVAGRGISFEIPIRDRRDR